MAIHRLLLSLAILIGLLAISVTARPCKTILFVSASSYYPLDQNPNPNLNLPLQNPSNPFNRPRFITFFFTQVREVNPKPTLHSYQPIFFDRVNTDVEKPHLPFKFHPSVSSSMRDRTKDIMSIVGALLFGVGCGALTAATMYLIWSLFSPHRFEFGDSDDDSDSDDVSPKKMGYVSIPVADDAVKSAPAKEVV